VGGMAVASSQSHQSIHMPLANSSFRHRPFADLVQCIWSPPLALQLCYTTQLGLLGLKQLSQEASNLNLQPRSQPQPHARLARGSTSNHECIVCLQ
jgi:hypothetical protein